MTRRELIQSLGLVSGHALFPSVLSGFLTNCANKEVPDYSAGFFTTDEMKSVIEIIDIILPATKTKSASEVSTHLFLDEVFTKCMTPQQQELIKEGLSRCIPALSDAEDKDKFVVELDRKAYAGDDDYAWFKTVKQYTLIGFFTSQEGTTKASNYVKVPEAYKAEIGVDERLIILA